MTHSIDKQWRQLFDVVGLPYMFSFCFVTADKSCDMLETLLRTNDIHRLKVGDNAIGPLGIVLCGHELCRHVFGVAK